MLKNLNNDIEVVEGIGPKIASLLRNNNVNTLLDLIVRPSKFYHRIVSSVASADEVEAWRRMVFFMQVDDIDGQFSEAIVKGKIKSLNLLGNKSLGDLQELFLAAKDKKIIPGVPDDEQLVNMIRESTQLASGQNLLGQVIDEDGKPAAESEITFASSKTVANKNGFFKLAGLNSFSKVVTVQTSIGNTYQFSDLQLRTFPDDVNIQVFKLSSESQIQRDIIDEFSGDILPSVNGEAFVVEHTETDTLRDGDVLMVRSFYKSSPNVKIESIFTAFDGVKFIARSYKFPLSKFGVEVKERDYLIFNNGKFRPTKVSRSGRANWKKLKQLRKENPTPSTVTQETLNAYLKNRISRLLENA
ncbi:MAG: hypothetical protein ACN4GR_00590 [Arenicellales bacterium]